jgi:predicted metal-dependent TIM-barrel fold hydrolase
MVPIFDPHVHMDTRNCTDYELFALAGVVRVLVPCSATRERKFCRRGYAERFDKLIDFERVRAASFGLRCEVALAVSGADIGDHDSACEGVEEVERRLDREGVVAVGELSLRAFTPQEVDVFERQLRLAERRGVPVLVESPPGWDDFARMLALLESALERGCASPHRVCLLDLNRDKLRAARHLGLGGHGIPVSPRFDGPFALREKLEPCEVLRLVDEFGEEGILLNSGLHAGFADPLCLPRTVLRLELEALDPATLRALALENAERFFDGRAA